MSLIEIFGVAVGGAILTGIMLAACYGIAIFLDYIKAKNGGRWPWHRD